MSEHIELASVHAERTILGAILCQNSAFYDADQELRAHEFYLDSHRRIYACISRLMSRGSSADTTTVAEDLRATRELEGVGGYPYILDLEVGIPRNYSISSYVRLVKEKASRREMRALGESLTSAAEEPGRTAEELIDCAEARLLEIRAGRDTSFGQAVVDEMGPLLKRMWEERNRPVNFLGSRPVYLGLT